MNRVWWSYDFVSGFPHGFLSRAKLQVVELSTRRVLEKHLTRLDSLVAAGFHLLPSYFSAIIS